MNTPGLEPRILEFLLGNGLGIRTVTDDYGRPYELDLNNHKPSPEWVLSKMTTWFYALDSNPYTLCQYMADSWFEEISDADDQWFVRNEAKLREFFIRIFVFVEPSGFRGDDTPQKRFADKLKEMLNTGELPDALRRIWEDVQKPEGRNRWTEVREQLGGYAIVPNSFEVYLIYNRKLLPRAIEKIVSVAYELGFTDRVYNPESAEHVDITNSLRYDFKCLLLRYHHFDRVPAFRYSMSATPEMTDAKDACISFDLLQLCHVPALENQDHPIPVLVWLARPDKPYILYDDPGSQTFRMNFRLLRHVWIVSLYSF